MRHPLNLGFASLLLLSSCASEPITPANSISSTAFQELETRISKLEQNSQNGVSSASSVAKSSAPDDASSVQTIQVDPARFDLQIDEAAEIKLAILSDASGKATVISNMSLLSFSSSDTNVISVSATGKIKALQAGVAAIQVKLGDAQTNIPVIVSATAATPTPAPGPAATPEPTPEPTPSATATPSSGVKSVALDPETIEVLIGQSKTFSSVVIILNPDDQQGLLKNFSAAEWESSDEDTVAVNESGVITGISEGTATITMTYKGFTDTAVVTVTAP